MKKNILLFFFYGIMMSCTEEPPPIDPCANTVCKNGGVCLSGVCDCPLGFEGDKCQTPISTTCDYSIYSGNTSCGAGKVPVAPSTCCPDTNPYYCGANNKCYVSCEAAEASGCGTIVKGSLSNGGTGGGSGSTTGQVIFWTNSDCGCGNIDITIDGLNAGQLTTYSSSAPTCGSSGYVTKTLSSGSHAYTAKCNGASWSGDVTISPNVCFKQQLACAPTADQKGKIMFWTKLNQQIYVSLVKINAGCGLTVTDDNSEVIKTTSYYNAKPSTCGATGCATFTRQDGSYQFSASSGGKSWSGCVTTLNECVFFELQ